jgi:hypothetical protein
MALEETFIRCREHSLMLAAFFLAIICKKSLFGRQAYHVCAYALSSKIARVLGNICFALANA